MFRHGHQSTHLPSIAQYRETWALNHLPNQSASPSTAPMYVETLCTAVCSGVCGAWVGDEYSHMCATVIRYKSEQRIDSNK